MSEREQVIVRPLEEVFDQRSVENLKRHGVKGVIPIEVSIDELMRIAEGKGYEADGVDIHPDNTRDGIGMYWVYPRQEGETAVVFYTKPVTGAKAVYILDDEFERFKELFFGR